MAVHQEHKAKKAKQAAQSPPRTLSSVSGPTIQPDLSAPQTLRRAVTQPGRMTPGGVQVLQRAYGNRAVTSLLPGSPAHLPIQAKLTVNPAGDAYEREADRVAGQVVSTLDGAQHGVQRQEEDEAVQTQTLSSAIQRLPGSDGGVGVAPETEEDIQGARSGGRPLADGVREPMEQAFGRDFSGVRVHADAKADTLNESLQARAFTTGSDIFFRSGEYNPTGSSGRQLLAHELTHVVQQGGGKKQLARDNVQMVQLSFANRTRGYLPPPTIAVNAPGMLIQRQLSKHTRRPIGDNRMVITMVVAPSGLGHTMLDFEWTAARRRRHYATHLVADNPFDKTALKQEGKVANFFGTIANKLAQVFWGKGKVEELADDPVTREEFFEGFEKRLKAKGKQPTKHSYTVSMRKGNKALNYARNEIGKKRHFGFLFPVRYARTNCFTFAYEVLLKAGLNLDWTAYLRSFISPRWAMSGGSIVPRGRWRQRRARILGGWG